MSFDFTNPTIADRVERSEQESSKTKEEAYGKLRMQAIFGGAAKLQEAIDCGEVVQVESVNGVEHFKMVTYEKQSKVGKRTSYLSLGVCACTHVWLLGFASLPMSALWLSLSVPDCSNGFLACTPCCMYESSVVVLPMFTLMCGL